MSRYPPTPTSEASEEYRPYSASMDEFTTASFGENGSTITYALPDGARIGPFPIMIASKEVGTALGAVLKSFNTLQSIPVDAKEVAILVTGARFGAKYELYAHRLIAMKKAGFTEDQVQAIKNGEKPKGLSEAANVAYDASFHLANEKGSLPSELYDAAVKVLGKEGFLLMTHFLGVYSYLSVLMNMADVPLPPGES